MKKVNLQLGSVKEMLTKEQMKKITGGYGIGGGTGTQSIVCHTLDSQNHRYDCGLENGISFCTEFCEGLFQAPCQCRTMTCHGLGSHFCG